ncbi:GGDEF domain-containing protein [Catenovulum sp. 2E275]|uniref:GGDEF domain-containing protein n=1 Tax=Catenovulum sp. 2E275 TaxID=2980497 RepID=UPI0021CFE6F9|nr:GGDEF domain-containing protein [Catenovulum sp. 2E275]MCU4675771.1 GGDEF domain-containing protein [Catenovulum sp. 2E275]
MKWEKLHQAFDKMTKQTSITQLNTLGLKFCRQIISMYEYRIYINQLMHNGDELDLAFINGKSDISDNESRIVKEMALGRKSIPSHFEEQGVQYFCVLNEGSCFALFAFKVGLENADISRINIFNTLITIWTNQLSVLYFYQRDNLTGLFTPSIFSDAVNGNTFYSDQSLEDDSIIKVEQDRRDDLHLPSSHAVVLIDIDDFKRVNERFGHSIGDEVLIKLARLMEISFRESDLICRFNGEQFAVLIRYVSKRSAEDILERFRLRVSESNFPRIETITVSIGYTMTLPGILTSELIDRATRSLNHAKESGKNCIISFDTVAKIHGDGFGNSMLEVGEIELF